MNIIQWVKPSFEDNDGKSSYRRFTAFFFVIADGYLLYADRIKSDIMLSVHYSLLAFILILTGIVTFQNIIDFKNGKTEVKN